MADSRAVNGNLYLHSSPAPAGSTEAPKVARDALAVLRSDESLGTLAAVGLAGGASGRSGVVTLSTAATDGTLQERLRVHSDGNVGIGTNAPATRLDVNGSLAIEGKQALSRRDAWLVLDDKREFASGVHTPGNFGPKALNVGGARNWGHPGDNNAWIAGKLNVGDYAPTNAWINAPTFELGGPDPSGDGARGGLLYLHDHGRVAHQLRYNNGTLYLEATSNGYGTRPGVDLSVGGEVRQQGAFVHVQGGGNEQAYLGGDGAGGDVQVGSFRGDITTVSMYNGATGWMDCASKRFVQKSDERYKDNIAELGGALDKLSRLRGVSFDWKGAPPEDSQRVGMIAQEVQSVLPVAVSQDGRGYLGLDYNAITSLLVQAVKEQQKLIEQLQESVRGLEQRLGASQGEV